MSTDGLQRRAISSSSVFKVGDVAKRHRAFGMKERMHFFIFSPPYESDGQYY